MADFQKALELTLRNEGSYVNNPLDRGGETINGIARKWHPKWPGWPIVDRAKQEGMNVSSVMFLKQIRPLVSDFYDAEFWLPIRGDQIESQPIANKLFDTAVNLSAIRAITFLQSGLNALNRNGRLWQDIEEDGVMGPVTLAVLKRCIAEKREDGLLGLMVVEQGYHYMRIMRTDPEQEEFALGWIRRLGIKV